MNKWTPVSAIDLTLTDNYNFAGNRTQKNSISIRSNNGSYTESLRWW